MSSDVARVLPSLIGIFRQADADEPIQRRRYERHERGNLGRLTFENGGDEARLRLALEGSVARKHLVENAAEREDIRSRIRLLPLDLFGCHVLQRPQDRSLQRRRRLQRGRDRQA